MFNEKYGCEQKDMIRSIHQLIYAVVKKEVFFKYLNAEENI